MDKRAAAYFQELSPAHQLLAKHLLMLGVEARWPNEVIARFVYTGFVVEVEDAWFWFTAGHIIEEILHAQRDGAVIVQKHFYDIGPNSRAPVDCPYDFSEVPYAYAEGGRDYAFVQLSPLTVAALRLNGVEAIHWRSSATTDIEFERYNFVGCLKAYQESIEGFVSFTPAVLIMDRMPDDVQADGFVRYRFDVSPSRDNWPHGKLDSLVGMSGGPVFGYRFQDDGETFVYSCIAIQSSWDPKTWVSYGSPLRIALNMIRGSMAADEDRS